MDCNHEIFVLEGEKCCLHPTCPLKACMGWEFVIFFELALVQEILLYCHFGGYLRDLCQKNLKRVLGFYFNFFM